MQKKFFEKLNELEKEYIDFWIDICNIESPTDFKEGVDSVGRYIIEKAQKRDWEVEVQEQKVSGNAICITMNSGSDNKPVCFSGHMDTVHPVGLFGSPAVKCDEEKIYGPGVLDCKGGIVSAFMTMAALDDTGYKKRPLKLILQSDEENSSRNSNKTTVEFMCKKAENCIAFLNCEGHQPGKIVNERKGIRKYKFEITGKAVHASKCYDGASAIREAAYKIIELEKLKDEDGLTCNCGLIEGGTAENTVPEKCCFTADIRFKTEDQMKKADELVKIIAQKSFIEGTRCDLTLASWRYAMEKTDKNTELIEKINKIFSENNIPYVEPVSRNGGSDAADMTHFGIPCADNIGVSGDYIHSKNEFAYLKSLKESAKMLGAIALSIE